MATVPHIFGTQPAGNVPASYLDVDFAYILGLATFNVTNYGAVGNGIADDVVAIQAAINAANAAGGGIVQFNPGGRYLIDSASLVMKDRVFLQGPLRNFGVPAWQSCDFSTVSPALIINSTFTIQGTGVSGGISGMIILRKGLMTPTDLASGQALQASLATGGIGITVGDNTNQAKGADFEISHCFIAGFQYGIKLDYADRVRIYNVHGHNEIEVYWEHAFDVGSIYSCHFWPFLVAQQSWTLTGDVWRTSRGVYLGTGTDGVVVQDVFAYGKNTGFENVSDFVRYVGCWADNSATGTTTGTRGFKISVPAKATVFDACAGSQNETGLEIDIGATPYDGDSFFIVGCNWNANVTNGVLVTQGRAIVKASFFYGSTNGLNCQSGSGVYYDGNVFDACTNPVVRGSLARSVNQTGKNYFVGGTFDTLGQQTFINGTVPLEELWAFNSNAQGPTYRPIFSRGTLGTPAAAQSGDIASWHDVYINTGSNNFNSLGGWRFVVAGVPAAGTSAPGEWRLAITPSGSVTPADILAVNSLGLTTVGSIFAISGGSFVGSNAAQLIASSVTMNNGAGANTGTLLNAPAAGNPTKWIAINDNGTIRYVPSW